MKHCHWEQIMSNTRERKANVRNVSLQVGFTLIELLVVIAIISVLATILLPSLSMARELARDSVCRSNQKSVGIAFMLYGSDYDGRLPLTANNIHDITDHSWWAEKLANYLMIDLDYSLPYPYTPAKSESGPLACPSDENPGSVHGSPISYGCNRLILDYKNPGREAYYSHMNIGMIPYPSEALLLADNKAVYGFHFWYMGAFPATSLVYGPYQEEPMRHPGESMNLLYTDGHVNSMHTMDYVAIRVGGGAVCRRLLWGEDTIPDKWNH